jgi:hypothetical protein
MDSEIISYMKQNVNGSENSQKLYWIIYVKYMKVSFTGNEKLVH